MKIYDENQFTKMNNQRGQEDIDNKSFDVEFANRIIKCMKGPSKSVGDTILKNDEKFNENRNIAQFNGQFKTLTGSIYKYSGTVTMKDTNDGKEDCEGNMLAAFDIHSPVPDREVEKYNLDSKRVEELIKQYLVKEIGDDKSVKEVKITDCYCETSYGKHVCGGECKLKLHTIV